MQEKKFYTCKYDRAFKEVFMKEDNKDILTNLLEEILEVKISNIVFLNVERNSDNIKLRRKIFDLNLNTNVGKIQLEVNAYYKSYTRIRNMAYICDTYSHYVLEGNDYNIDTQIIQINFNYGFSFKSNRLCHIYKIKDQDNNLLVKNFTVYEFDMDKYKSLWYNKNIKEIEKNKYIIMLDLNPEELKSLSNKDRMVNKYMSELKRINENPKFREYMSAEEDNRKIENTLRREAIEEGFQEGLEEGIEQGIEKGIEQGKEKAKIEVAKSILENKIDPKIIKNCTGLSIEEINNL